MVPQLLMYMARAHGGPHKLEGESREPPKPTCFNLAMFAHSPFASTQPSLKIPSTRRRILHSVFPPSANESSATPITTPTQTPNASRHSTPFPNIGGTAQDPTPAEHFTKFHQTWHLVTQFLTFTHDFFDPSTIHDVSSANNILALRKAAGFAANILDSIRYLNSGEVRDLNLRGSNEGLIEWYTWETRRHFNTWAPELLPPRTREHYKVWLKRCTNLILVAHTLYTGVLREFVLVGLTEEEAVIKAKEYTTGLNAAIGFGLPEPAWSNAVHETWLRLCAKILGVPGIDELEKNVALARDPKKVKMMEIMQMEGIEDEGCNAGTLPGLTQSLDLGLELEKKRESLMMEDAVDSDADMPPPSSASSEATDDDGEQKPYYKVLYPTPRQFKAKSKLIKMWATFQLLGLAGSGRKGERIFAEVIYKLLNTYITACYAAKWESPSSVTHDLNIWIDEGITKLVRDVLGTNVDVDVIRGTVQNSKRILTPRESFKLSAVHEQLKRRSDAFGISQLLEQEMREETQVVRNDDIESWKSMAINKLGSLRVGELFDIVIDWPDSLGGIEDLREYITTPESRLHLTNTFIDSMNTRLLHPGAATADILRVYISLIRAFSVLDPRGVLLDRCSRSIKRYLKERDDTLKIIVRGLFGAPASGEIVGPDDVVLSDLADELREFVPGAAGAGEPDDFDDINWVPDPVDAASDFRKTRGSDVIGSLLDLHENKEPLVKEIMSYLSIRLLCKDCTSDADIEHEIRTLELLKLRIPENTLQSCDVMIKDIIDSRHMDSNILPGLPPDTPFPRFHTKILSSLYWPRLKSETFTPPPPMASALVTYSDRYEKLHPKRKINWVLGEGLVSADIELRDRIIKVDNARPAYLAFIYAFASEDDSAEVTFTQEQLAEKLQMDPHLVAKAAAYWRNKGALRITPPNTYSIIEALSSSPISSAPTSQAIGVLQEDEPGSSLSEQEKVMYSQYVVTMLTNMNKPMSTQEIHSFLNMLLPGGCAVGEGELARLMETMEGVYREGESWRGRK
ncbi:hypothetical protein BJ508DRAFT_311624 [Ascobolus immersus RN42]|uniref:Anaphase-promoting complex subunit 2 n=1 Tax=Ascobolus immersus RN42 TaxID=1160509 RepID=A0A3N4HVD8_ASCIM|nr:hypothetical protein BJ508DRAFT_311624 [Ascobolus immersus RN42]